MSVSCVPASVVPVTQETLRTLRKAAGGLSIVTAGLGIPEGRHVKEHQPRTRSCCLKKRNGTLWATSPHTRERREDPVVTQSQRNVGSDAARRAATSAERTQMQPSNKKPGYFPFVFIHSNVLRTLWLSCAASHTSYRGLQWEDPEAHFHLKYQTPPTMKWTLPCS